MKTALTLALVVATLVGSPAVSKPLLPQIGAPHTHSQANELAKGSQWSKGGRVPGRYQNSKYTVSDWRHRNLPAPARGSRWVRNGTDQFALSGRRGHISDIVGQSDHPDTHRWARGERVPSYYRAGSYVVTDWQQRHLRRPNRGYHWVHVNNQYLLIAIATGLIGSLIADGH